MGRPPASLLLFLSEAFILFPVLAGCQDTKKNKIQFFLQGNYNLVPLYTTNYETYEKGTQYVLAHSTIRIERNQNLQGVWG